MKLLLKDGQIVDYFIKTGTIVGLTTFFTAKIKLWQKCVLLISTLYYLIVLIYFLSLCVQIIMMGGPMTGKVLFVLYSITFKSFPIVVILNTCVQRKNIRMLCAYVNKIEKELDKRKITQRNLQKKISLWFFINIIYFMWELRFWLIDEVSDIFTINLMQFCIMFIVFFMYVLVQHVQCKSFYLNEYVLNISSDARGCFAMIQHLRSIENCSRIIGIVIKQLSNIFGAHIINYFIFLVITLLTVANLTITDPDIVEGPRFFIIRIIFLVSRYLRSSYRNCSI